MSKKALRIVYMGTPEFAVAPLKKLVEEGYTIAGVITAPDKPAGRGKIIRYSAVKQYALAHGLQLMQPDKLRNEAFISELKSLNPDLQVVVAFRMLPEVVWSIPPIGTFNLHASLLPDYRGAAPINWAIINGETETGLTSFLIDQQIDTGRILLQKKMPIYENDNAGSLHDRMMKEGADLVLKTIEALETGTVSPLPQDQVMPDHAPKPAPKIRKEDCRIDWTMEGRCIQNFIRGLSPYPGAFSILDRNEKGELLFKVFESSYIPESHTFQPGAISTDHISYIHVAAKNGWISIKVLQQSGKKALPVEQFLMGFRFRTSSDLFF